MEPSISKIYNNSQQQLSFNSSLKGNLGAPIYLFSFLLQVGALSAFLPFNVKLICLKEKHDHLKMDIATWCYKWMADGRLSTFAKSTDAMG